MKTMPTSRSNQRASSLNRAPVDRTREVLVVDDEADVQELLGEIFRGMNLKVATAVDGRAAIAAIERDPDRYWLVLTDIAMPGADGLAVLQAAKAANPMVQVVIMTGYGSLDTAVKAIRLGAFDYLPKPITLGEVEMMMHRLGERQHLERATLLASPSSMLDPSQARLLGRLDEIILRLERLERLCERPPSSGEEHSGPEARGCRIVDSSVE